MKQQQDCHSTEESLWQGIVSQLSDAYVEEVFRLRQVDEKLKPLVTSELLIYLGLLIGSKLNEDVSEHTALQVIKYYMRRVYDKGKSLGIPYHRIISKASSRHDFYLTGLFEKDRSEDFLRTAGMQWFQFPLQEIDGEIRPYEFDFSVYFSDLNVVSEVLFKIAPNYANGILASLKQEVPSFILHN
ncbi:hypothetical protein BFP72_06760 [Reichenbachiella sp. 5M10]|uniref:hypothetical protein n=1 Tax=Reichenbachiella sp. 5M10 TaxID=1889772 RepID=UPI000C15AEFE|nr:hypothetical protein [Reichenbachiella sp. 5M10]PIB35116.1 hypothetical protein BFP72_06760 [Reichenbachiella sp. 5M10]